VRKKPSSSRDAFAPSHSGEEVEDYVVTSDDLATVLLEFEGGARGMFSAGQICPGHKNDMRIEVNGSLASIQWNQEQSNQLWIGYRDRPNALLTRDPNLLDEEVRRYARLPAGHDEGWADAFRNLMSNIYSFIGRGLNPRRDSDQIDFPTFQDGYLANCVVDAIIRSNMDLSRWTSVDY
jgi:predicted dehydrogenase